MVEIRKSSRANKGQNSKLDDQIKYEQELAQSRRSRAKITDAIPDDAGDGSDSDSVQCLVCGTTDENYDEDNDENGDMIQCDDCSTWQHTKCILGKNKVPADYKCNVCDPNNESYNKLSLKIDPSTLPKKQSKSKATKLKPLKKNVNGSSKKQGNSSNGKEDADDNYKNDEEDDDDQNFSSNDERVQEDDDDDDDEFRPENHSSRQKRSRTRSIDESKKSTPPKIPRRHSSKSNASFSEIDTESADAKTKEIESKAREAVTSRFEKMFNELLKDTKVLNEENESNETISKKWATKLEEELYNVYHNRETGNLTRDYKEGSTRIFVNAKDEKNIKLRKSIINKSVSFNKLVKMPVTELLNPDLRKEKEEAIKESMTLATLDAPKVSNIRRTHKGDIVLEKDDSSSTNQQFDFNVGMSIDSDEKKFTKSENSVTINERKSSSAYNDHNDQFDDKLSDNEHGDENNRDRSHSIQDDDAILQILGETEKDQKAAEATSNDEYIPNQLIWSGQLIFIGVTNFASEATLAKTTLNQNEVDKISSILIDHELPLEIEGRLDSKKADDYIRKVSESRKLILIEIKSKDQGHNEFKNFNKLFDYFFSKSKVGVVKLKLNFIKDSYLIATKGNYFPKFFNILKQKRSEESKLFIVIVIKQELIDSIKSPSTTTSGTTTVPSFEFLSRLNPHELELVNKIFDERPETRVDSNLLIQYLKKKLEHQNNN